MAKKKKKKAKSRSVKKITKNQTISSVINKYPQTANVFISHEMHCFGCAMASGETIEQGAKAHPNINLNKLITDLNKAANKKLDKVEEKISTFKQIQKPKKRSFLKRLFRRK